MEDIVPSLLEAIESEYKLNIKNSIKLKELLELLNSKKATYKDANSFAIEVGEILSNAYKNNIITGMLPDDRMYFNIAERILNPTMKTAYNTVADFSTNIQNELNQIAKIKIKGIRVPLNQDKINGIINRISSEENFENIQWILGDPIKTFCQSIVDDTIKANVKFHADLGLKPTITRTSRSTCCDWCQEIAGTYSYPDVPDDIYRRHNNCDCDINYNPGDGRKQNVHTKVWV